MPTVNLLHMRRRGDRSIHPKTARSIHVFPIDGFKTAAPVAAQTRRTVDSRPATRTGPPRGDADGSLTTQKRGKAHVGGPRLREYACESWQEREPTTRHALPAKHAQETAEPYRAVQAGRKSRIRPTREGVACLRNSLGRTPKTLWPRKGHANPQHQDTLNPGGLHRGLGNPTMEPIPGFQATALRDRKLES